MQKTENSRRAEMTGEKWSHKTKTPAGYGLKQAMAAKLKYWRPVAKRQPKSGKQIWPASARERKH
jgi:hypothetical protein